MANANLGKAKVGKNDEFYTQYADIQKEVNAYLEYDANVFRGKTILLPCDDPEWSNFTKFFAQNFEQYGIRKLIERFHAQPYNPAMVQKRVEALFADEYVSSKKGIFEYVSGASTSQTFCKFDSLRSQSSGPSMSSRQPSPRKTE